jgi:phosphoglycolate phosphatase-like HAD superfamily hydrolase
MLPADALPTNLKYGVVTGRSRSETHLALKMAKLLNRIPDTAWQTPEDGVRKPDGRTLITARDKLDFRYGIYIGDTMDDLQTVINYRSLKGAGRARIISCIALSGPSGDKHRRLFLEAGAEIVAPDAETILQYLGHVLK